MAWLLLSGKTKSMIAFIGVRSAEMLFGLERMVILTMQSRDNPRIKYCEVCHEMKRGVHKGVCLECSVLADKDMGLRFEDGVRVKATEVSPSSFKTEDKGKPGRTPRGEQWFDPQVETGWEKGQNSYPLA